MTRKDTLRKIAKAKLAVEKLRSRILSHSKGVFKVVIAKLEERESGDLVGKVGVPFAVNILPLCSEIHRMLPFARPESSFGFINVWTDTLEEAEKVRALDNILGIPVFIKSEDLRRVWTIISGVGLGFSEEDIAYTLKDCGVCTVRRETTRRIIGGSPTQFPTTGVRLRFKSVPLASVTLGYKSYKVTLHAGGPILCFNCLRYGHAAVKCGNQRVCRRCGSQGHQIKDCKGSDRCVNCRGAHRSGAWESPLRACEYERKKTLVENC